MRCRYEVEALPAELPEKIEVNVEHLANINDQITVADLQIPEGVTVLTEAEQVVAKIAELVTKEAQEQAAAEAAAATPTEPEVAKKGGKPEEADKKADAGGKKSEAKK